MPASRQTMSAEAAHPAACCSSGSARHPHHQQQSWPRAQPLPTLLCRAQAHTSQILAVSCGTHSDKTSHHISRSAGCPRHLVSRRQGQNQLVQELGMPRQDGTRVPAAGATAVTAALATTASRRTVFAVARAPTRTMASMPSPATSRNPSRQSTRLQRHTTQANGHHSSNLSLTHNNLNQIHRNHNNHISPRVTRTTPRQSLAPCPSTCRHTCPRFPTDQQKRSFSQPPMASRNGSRFASSG